jgi:Ca2+-binding RTX toxin-like protein
MKGGRGNDALVGGPGKNRYAGGSGRDRINARNRVAETVRCGAGRDRARVDAADHTIGCERVRRPRA